MIFQNVFRDEEIDVLWQSKRGAHPAIVSNIHDLGMVICSEYIFIEFFFQLLILLLSCQRPRLTICSNYFLIHGQAKIAKPKIEKFYYRLYIN